MSGVFEAIKYEIRFDLTDEICARAGDGTFKTKAEAVEWGEKNLKHLDKWWVNRLSTQRVHTHQNAPSEVTP